MHMPSGTQLLVIALIILVLFGGRKIPELAKGLGSGIKNFKNALNENDETNKVAEVTTTTLEADKKIWFFKQWAILIKKLLKTQI